MFSFLKLPKVTVVRLIIPLEIFKKKNGFLSGPFILLTLALVTHLLFSIDYHRRC